MRDISIIGIDPGQKGAICRLTVDSAICYPLSCKASQDIPNIKECFTKQSIVFIEQVHAMPGQGVSSSFTFGRNLGLVEGILWTLGAKEIRYLNPRVWQKIVGVEGIKDRKERKQALILKALNLFPERSLMRTHRSKIPDSGMADALLIAFAGLHVLNQE